MSLGSTNWRTSTDPDHTHERLLDVSRIGPRGDFGVSVGAPAVVGGNGGTARFAITLSRSATLFERIRLSIANAPSGFSGTFDVPAPFGFAGVASTLTVTVPAGLSAGTYNVTVVGGRARQPAHRHRRRRRRDGRADRAAAVDERPDGRGDQQHERSDQHRLGRRDRRHERDRRLRAPAERRRRRLDDDRDHERRDPVGCGNADPEPLVPLPRPGPRRGRELGGLRVGRDADLGAPRGASVRGQLQRDVAQRHVLGRLRGHHDVRDERGRPRPDDVQRSRHRGRRTR